VTSKKDGEMTFTWNTGRAVSQIDVVFYYATTESDAATSGDGR